MNYSVSLVIRPITSAGQIELSRIPSRSKRRAIQRAPPDHQEARCWGIMVELAEDR